MSNNCPVCILSQSRYCRQCGRLVRKQREYVDQDLIKFQASVTRQNKKGAKHRKCRECGKPTGISRYFVCGNCLPTPFTTSEDSFIFPAAPGVGLWVSDVA